MPRIRFTADPKLPRDLAHLAYRKDQEVELSADLCDRWLRRGVAILLLDAPPPKPAAAAPLSPRVSRGRPSADTMAADSLGAESVPGADSVDAV